MEHRESNHIYFQHCLQNSRRNQSAVLVPSSTYKNRQLVWGNGDDFSDNSAILTALFFFPLSTTLTVHDREVREERREEKDLGQHWSLTCILARSSESQHVSNTALGQALCWPFPVTRHNQRHDRKMTCKSEKEKNKIKQESQIKSFLCRVTPPTPTPTSTSTSTHY
jgi:hypothetical protein